MLWRRRKFCKCINLVMSRGTDDNNCLPRAWILASRSAGWAVFNGDPLLGLPGAKRPDPDILAVIIIGPNIPDFYRHPRQKISPEIGKEG